MRSQAAGSVTSGEENRYAALSDLVSTPQNVEQKTLDAVWLFSDAT